MKQKAQITRQDVPKVEIRPANADDMNDLLTIEKQCFNVPHYAFHTFDRHDFRYYLDDPDCLFLAATLAGRLIGYVLGPITTRRKPPAAHIDSIAVLPDRQHEGVGSRLLESFRDLIRRRDCQIVTLEVSPANEVGLAFFARHGFREVRRLDNYYGKGLHALLLAAHDAPQPHDGSRR